MFKIGSRVFLVVANGHRLQGNGPSRYAINSTIYELDMIGQLFVRFQDIVTYRYMCAEGARCTDTGGLRKTQCVVTRLLLFHHLIINIPLCLSSAVDWEYFSLGEEHFLVVANSFNGESYSLNSVLYRYSTCQHHPSYKENHPYRLGYDLLLESCHGHTFGLIPLLSLFQVAGIWRLCSCSLAPNDWVQRLGVFQL